MSLQSCVKLPLVVMCTTNANENYCATQADVDDLPAAKAILRGMKKYKERTGKVPILIHTVRFVQSIEYDDALISATSHSLGQVY